MSSLRAQDRTGCGESHAVSKEQISDVHAVAVGYVPVVLHLLSVRSLAIRSVPAVPEAVYNHGNGAGFSTRVKTRRIRGVLR